MAPIAAGAQDYQVCWIFKASGTPPFLRWQTAHQPAAPGRIHFDVSGEAALVLSEAFAAVKESAKR
jgi:hypothetical protein